MVTGRSGHAGTGFGSDHLLGMNRVWLSPQNTELDFPQLIFPFFLSPCLSLSLPPPLSPTPTPIPPLHTIAKVRKVTKNLFFKCSRNVGSYAITNPRMVRLSTDRPPSPDTRQPLVIPLWLCLSCPERPGLWSAVCSAAGVSVVTGLGKRALSPGCLGWDPGSVYHLPYDLG